MLRSTHQRCSGRAAHWYSSSGKPRRPSRQQGQGSAAAAAATWGRGYFGNEVGTLSKICAVSWGNLQALLRSELMKTLKLLMPSTECGSAPANLGTAARRCWTICARQQAQRQGADNKATVACFAIRQTAGELIPCWMPEALPVHVQPPAPAPALCVAPA